MHLQKKRTSRQITLAMACIATFVAIRAQGQEMDQAIFYRSTIAAAEKAIRLNETREAKSWLAASPSQHRGWEWAFLKRLSDTSSECVALGDVAATSMDVSADGRLLAIAFVDGRVTVHALPEMKKLSDIIGHDEAVYSVEFSPDSTRIVTVSRDVTSRVWDVATGEEISRIQLANPGVAAATFSPSGDQVATCSWMMTEDAGKRQVHGVVWIWNATDGAVIHESQVGVKPLDSIAWSPDGDRIVVGSWDGLVHCLSEKAEEVRQHIVPDVGIYTAVIAVAISPDNKWIACGSKDRTARIWNAESGELVSTLKGHDGFVNEVRFGPESDRLYTASTDGAIRCWNVITGEPLKVLRGHDDSVVAFDLGNPALEVLDNGSKPEPGISENPPPVNIFSVSRDGTVRVWCHPQKDSPEFHKRMDIDGAYTTTWSPDGQRIYVACYDGRVRVLDADSADLVAEWIAHEGNTCNTLSLSADGQRLLTCSWDSTARLWNTADRSLIRTLELDSAAYDCALSADGNRIALTIGATVEIWNADTGERLGVCEGTDGGRFTEVTFAPGGAMVAAAGAEGPAVVWHTDDFEIIAQLDRDGQHANTVAWSQAGDLLATGTRGIVQLWKSESMELLRTYQVGASEVRHLAFSPDGNRLFAASDAVVVINPQLENTLLRFQPCDDEIYFLAVSPDSSKLASCTTGGLIAISSSATSSPLAPSNAPGNDMGRQLRQDWSIDSARILYSANRMGTRSLHVLERKSGQSQPVALELDDGTGANNADVSPDGKQSVFQRLQPGNYDLDVVRLTGGKPTTFVEHPAYEVSPIWSPDGKQIAFMSTRGFELGSIGPSFQDMSIFRTWMTAN